MWLRGASALALLGLLGCADTEKADYQYDVDLRWTSYGIPHVKANDWGSLGYGFAYATATDAVCVIAKDVQMVNGNLSAHFGPEGGNLPSDIFHKAILTDAKLADYDQQQSARAKAMNVGYAAGYNRFLEDHKDTMPKSCAGADWVRPITETDLIRLGIGVGIRYGLGRFQKQIAQASPEPQQTELAQAEWKLPAGIGSNAIAIGRDLSANGRGILLGNPHYPWHGASRFHMIHLTLPGELDVMGASLLTTNRVAIGFNKDMAWTHTVSTAKRFTLYQLTLNPENPYEYLYDGEYRAMQKRTVTVPVPDDETGTSSEQSHTTYFTHFGPVVESKALPWNGQMAFALRDAVVDNYLTAETYDALAKATSTAEVEAAISQQGVYWTNTIAADRQGNAFYADISGTPNIDQGLLERCQIDLPDSMSYLILLRGDDSQCEWYEDPASRVPGTLAPDNMPRLTRSDYVSNSNDSYWLSNPAAPLEGYSPVIGDEGAARSLRTRAGLSQLTELQQGKGKVSPQDLRDMLYNQRNYAAELLLDDLLVLCANDDELQESCNALKNWDRTMNVGSRGGHVWREFWRDARSIDKLFAQDFDATNPVATPAGLNIEDPAVRPQLRLALLAAEQRLDDANIALDATLGEIQYAQRNDAKIPIPGGEGWAGMFSMIRTNLQADKGYAPIFHGNSYIQTIGWNADGSVDAQGMLTYSQSPEPDSPHYKDLTELYAAGKWIDLPFTEQAIASDPQLRSLRLQQ
ncbi:MAG: penicillin acylase family protein [Pseudomonadota bacterium]|nr:penicillin acylase family protein [Pseudomonadota bacterium]